MTPPLVSVCIPTFNGGDFLAQTLESVLAQTYPRIEIVISDDASSDDTRRIIEEFRDERFEVLLHDEPTGASANWNSACALATGEYIKLLCQDDLLLPRCLEAQVDALESNPSATFAWSARDVISPRGRRLLRSRGYHPDRPVVSMSAVVRDIVRSGTNPFGEPCAVLMRTDAVRSTEGFRGRYTIDLDMWLQLLRRGPAVHVPGTHSQFRISSGSWTAQLQGEHAADVRGLAEGLVDEDPSHVSSADIARGSRRAAMLERFRSILIAFISITRL